MKNLKIEKVFCVIKYEANDNPKCKILVDEKIIHDFIASGDEENFSFEVKEGPFKFRILQYNKNMKTDTKKFIEVKAIYFNDIDFKNKIWETTQVAELPHWQSKEDFKWDANLYLGHNGYIEYKMQSPVIDFLLEYHTKGAKVSSNMGSYNMDLLYEMKEYFGKIVKAQDEKS
tara:strand:+ start:460 stop:978 length:519 start_codon:yes stop_codon:yes gene_type:complete